MSQASLSFVENELLDPIDSTFVAQPDVSSLESLKNAGDVLRRLSSIDWAFTEEKTGYLSHDIHPYPAKFIPQIPRNIIAQLSVRGELVWDPFGGCGTTALEAILMGRCALSTDINPLGEIIGEAKTLTLTKEEEEVVSDFSEQLLLLSKNRSHVVDELREGSAEFRQFIPSVPNLEDWFHDNAISELAYLRWRIEHLREPKAVVLAKVAFSKSILKASFQDEETRYARRPREIQAGSILSLFATNLSSALRKVKQLGSLLRFREAEFKTIDLRARSTTENESGNDQSIVENSVDLIVTSPPYPNTTDYHLYHRFRLFWLGFDPRDLARKEIGSHLRHQKEKTGFESYISEMSQCLATMKATLRPGRYAVLVVGSGVFKGRVYDSAASISAAAEKLGFQVVGAIGRQIHSTKRSFITPARRLRAETILVLRKPDCKFRLTLLKPPYKLWPYEDSLRKKEIQTVMKKSPREAGGGNLSVKTSSLSIDGVRRLTFTHGFLAKEISKNPTWQATLENGDAASAVSLRKDPKYATHGIHAYKGKFYPQLAKSLFNLAGLVPGQTVLDPFCGSGTVLLESYLNGLRGVGTDINVLAVKIARVKTEILEVDPYLRDRILSRFQDRLDTLDTSKSMISFFPEASREELQSWFPRPVLEKLAILLDNIEHVSEPSVRELLEILTSSIVREISHQDPKDLRIRRRHEPLKDAPVFQLFRQRLMELRRRLQQFSERAKSAPHLFYPANAILGDGRSPDTFQQHGVVPNSIDAIVTSPPYATALPYIDTDRLSILLLFGLTSRKRSALEESLIGTREITKKSKASLEMEIDSGNFASIFSKTARSIILEVRKRNADSDAGFRRQNMAALLYLYFRDMSVVMSNLNPLLRKGASAFFVIGNTRTTARGKIVEIKSAEVLQEIGCALGWKIEEIIPITVTTENRRHSKNSITANSIIWFKKLRS